MRTPVSLTVESMLDAPVSVATPVSVTTPVSIATDESVSVALSSAEPLSLTVAPSLPEPPSVAATQRVRPPLVSQRSPAAQAGLQLETQAPDTHEKPSRHEGTQAVGGGGLHAASAVESAKPKDKSAFRMAGTIARGRAVALASRAANEQRQT